MALVGYSNGEKIYNYLISAGFTPAGASATLGNLDAESGLSPNNLENRKEANLGSDTYYTSAVNNGTYTKEQFVHDGAGYGIAQWTYYSRKQKLYERTVEKGFSIADLERQCYHLVEELKGFTTLYNILKTTNDVHAASDMFLEKFEAPSVPNYEDRRKRSDTYYNRYGKNYTPPSVVEDTTIKEEAQEEVSIPTTTLNKTYKVLSGEGWWQIAAKVLKDGTRMHELAALNGKTVGDIIYTGQILKLPDDAVVEEDTTSSNKSYYEYIVKPGEGWWQVAMNTMKDGNKMHEIAAFNNKTISSILHPNMVLKIPYTLPSTSADYALYTVKKNDTWRTIADTQLGDWRKMNYLAKYNGKTTKNILTAGSVLKIPKL